MLTLTDLRKQIPRFFQKWHFLYYFLAPFTLIAISSVIYINHNNLIEDDRALKANEITISILRSAGELLALSQKVNAPGNSVFATRNIEKEKGKYLSANKEFEESLKKFRSIATLGITENQRNEVEKQIDELQKAVIEMQKTGFQIFRFFARGEERKAEAYMAEMDLKFSIVLELIESVRRYRIDLQSKLLAEHTESLRDSQTMELLFSGLILIAIIGVVYYGRKISKLIKQSSVRDAHLAGIVSSSADAIFGADINGLITSWNRGAEQTFGYKAAEIIGKSKTILFPVGTEHEDQEIRTAISGHNGVYLSDSIRVTKSGKHLSVSVSVSPLVDLNGKVIGSSHIVRDITEQKRREKELQRIAETTHDGLVIYDSAGKVLRYNHGALSILGMTPSELSNRNNHEELWKFFYEDGTQVQSKNSPSAITLQTGKPIKGTIVEVLTPEGKRKWLTLNSVLLDENANPSERQVVVTFSDISSLIQVKSELNDFFRSSLDLICIANIDGYFKKINPSFRRILGYSEQELMSRPFFEFINPDDVKAAEETLQRLGQGSSVENFECRMRTKSGENRIISWQCQPDVKSGALYATGRDITDQRQSELGFRQTIAALDRSAIVAFTDSRGKITEVNDNFCSISGFSREELIGKDHRIINSGTHDKSFFKNMWQTISSGKIWSGEVQNRRKTGELYWVKTVITPLLDSERKATRFLAIRFDVTAQKLAEQEKESLLRQFKEAQSIARIGSWSLDLANQYQIWSSENYKIFEIIEPQPKETLLQLCLERIHPEDLSKVHEAFDRARIHGVGFTHEHRLLFADGRVKHVRIIGKVTRDANEKPISISGTCQDITTVVETEKKLSDERIKATHNAKLASLGEMSAGIAHEINNPLAIISGSIGLIQKYVSDPEKLSEKVQTIRKSCDRISKIVLSLKKFSRSDERVAHQPHSLAEIVRETLVLTSVKAKRFDTSVVLECNTESKILCNEVEIEQVLINLINNGIDAAKENIEKWVKVTISEEESVLVVRISDSGKGIPDKLRAKLFEPFFTTKKVGEGTGLGLSISKGILDEHKAAITLASNSPNTCFEIRFPKYISVEKAA